MFTETEEWLRFNNGISISIDRRLIYAIVSISCINSFNICQLGIKMSMTKNDRIFASILSVKLQNMFKYISDSTSNLVQGQMYLS